MACTGCGPVLDSDSVVKEAAYKQSSFKRLPAPDGKQEEMGPKRQAC
jgi:hypothetical protein